MDLHNRWGDKIEGNDSGGLIGPDGKPLSTPEQDKSAEKEEVPQLDFFNYIASLGFQAMIFLGEVPHPMSQQIEKNLTQAKFLIDTLVLLKEKTTGNLTKEEAELLDGSVYELQLRYVQAQKNGSA